MLDWSSVGRGGQYGLAFWVGGVGRKRRGSVWTDLFGDFDNHSKDFGVSFGSQPYSSDENAMSWSEAAGSDKFNTNK